MGCLKLTYRSETPTLKVVRNTLKESEKPCTGAYRFGFNGMEADDEITGVTGSHYTAEFWQYDSRLGRRWNLDPEPQISVSDYATFKNSPIILTDPLGNSADWYKNDKGNVIWRDSHDATYEGEQGTYENIGTTYSQKLADGSYANYYQDELVGYTEKGKYNFKSTNAKSYLLGNKSPLSKENQSEYYNGLVRGAGKQFIENGGWMVGAAMVSPFIIGGAVTGLTALPSLSATISGAKKAYESGQLLYMTIQGSEGAIGIGTGIGIGVTEYLFNAPPDLPASSNPVIQGTREMTNIGIKVIEETSKEIKRKIIKENKGEAINKKSE